MYAKLIRRSPPSLQIETQDGSCQPDARVDIQETRCQRRGMKTNPAAFILLKGPCSNGRRASASNGSGWRLELRYIRSVSDFSAGQPFNAFSFWDFGICCCLSSAYHCKAIYMLMCARYTVVFVCFERIYCNVGPISTGCRGGEGLALKLYKGSLI